MVLVLYMDFGGRFGLDSVFSRSTPTRRGKYGAGNAYKQYNQHGHRDTTRSNSNNQYNYRNGAISTYRTQFQTVDDVPKSFFQNQKSIYAYTERVIDGDTIRVRHIPSYNWIRQTPVPLEKRALSDCTLSIRIYGVDTPEIEKTRTKSPKPLAMKPRILPPSAVCTR